VEGAPARTTSGGVTVHAFGRYEGALAECVRALKYREGTGWAAYLGRKLHQVSPASFSEATLLPVPLHAVRLAERGYNQSALIARGISRASGANVDFSTVAKIRETHAQAKLNERARMENVRDSFRASSRRGKLRVVLVDDVLTTGSTIDACAAALREQGHEILGGLCLAFARVEEDDSGHHPA